MLERSLELCPTTGSQLWLLEVFQGISSREFIKTSLHSQYSSLVESLVSEVEQLTETFHCQMAEPPLAHNLPPVSGALMWLYGVKQRVSLPVQRLEAISLSLLESENGRKLRQLQARLFEEIAQCETKTVNKWQTSIESRLKEKMNEPLLKLSPSSESSDMYLLEVNLDPHLLVVLREASYLSLPPLSVSLPETVQSLVDSIDLSQIWSTVVKLEAIANKHNEIVSGMTDVEKQLFELKLFKMKSVGLVTCTVCELISGWYSCMRGRQPDRNLVVSQSGRQPGKGSSRWTVTAGQNTET